MNPLTVLPYLNFITVLFAILITIGGFFAFRSGRQSQLSKFQEAVSTAQEATNTALQQRLDVLTQRLADVEQERDETQANLQMVLELMQKRYRMTITFDNGIVSVTDGAHTSTHHKRSPPKARTPGTNKSP